jgi:hypothetical protein
MLNGRTSTYGGIVRSNAYNNRLQPVAIYTALSTLGNPPIVIDLCHDYHLGVAINTGFQHCSFGAYTTGDNGNVFQILNNVLNHIETVPLKPH